MYTYYSDNNYETFKISDIDINVTEGITYHVEKCESQFLRICIRRRRKFIIFVTL